jgi:hypothetical protein
VEKMSEAKPTRPLFNSPLETGVRSVVLLNAAHPKKFDLGALTLLDHVVVHTADIGGPESLHPTIPQRTGELLVRRQLVEAGLLLMRRIHLVDMETTNEGLYYAAADDASSIVDLMRTPYAVALKQRANWLADHLRDHDVAEIRKAMAERIDVWATEFQQVASPGGAAI